MKYILLLLFYAVMGTYHMADIVVRTIFNLLIATWDFRWGDKRFYSYKTVWYIGEKFGDGKGRRVPLSHHYSWKYFLSEP